MQVFERLKQLIRLVWLLGLLSGLSAAEPPAAEPEASEPAKSDFDGKVVGVRLRGDALVLLENVQKRQLGHRYFLVGKAAPNGVKKDPVDGQTLWIAVDEICRICEFKDLAVAQKCQREAIEQSVPSEEGASEKDVNEINDRSFNIPVHVDSDQRELIEKARLYLSRDHGKTWKHYKDFEADDRVILFTAPEDGLYWFAVQTVLKDGTKTPAEVKDLMPNLKVNVQTGPTDQGQKH